MISRDKRDFFSILLFLIIVLAGCMKNGEKVKNGEEIINEETEIFGNGSSAQDVKDVSDLLRPEIEETERGVREVRDPEEMYQEGIAYIQKAEEKSSFLRNERYLRALNIFKEIKERYTYSDYATLAEIEIGDCNYRMEKYDESIAAYQSFRELHPNHEQIPYVIYKSGLAYFQQIVTIDRDQTMIQKAIREFEYLINNYPDSEYVRDSREKIIDCRKGLAERTLYIGEFYFKKENYPAALSRFEELLIHYPGLGFDETANLYIRKCKDIIPNEN